MTSQVVKIKSWLSRYSWRYPRSLVYMLQASEYHIGDYFRWYWRTADFNRVERRKRLIFTPKAVLLLAVAWIILLAWYAFGLMVFLSYIIPILPIVIPAEAGIQRRWIPIFMGMTGGAVIFLSAPYLLAYLLAAKAFFLKFAVQLPAEYFIIRRARRKLAAHQAFKIAIAGSFGKTTMREILKTVLGVKFKTAAPSENYNTPIGISRFIKNLKGDEEVLIFELGEYYPGDVRRLCRLIQPRLGIITGVNEAHLKRFKTLNRTADTIFELAKWLSRGGHLYIYVNGENQLAKKKIRQTQTKDVTRPYIYVCYDRMGAGEWRVENARTDLSGVSFEIVSSVIAKPPVAGEAISVKIHSQLLGLHQIGPLAAAADIAFRLGMSPEEIQRGLSNTKPVNHRLEPRTDGAGITIIDDSYNGNPDGAAAAIDFLGALNLPAGGRRFYVTPGLVEMGMGVEPAHLNIGRQLAKVGIEVVILIKTSVSSYIKQGLVGNGHRGKIMEFGDMPAALAALPYLTVKGDVVLLQNDWPDQYV